MATGRPKHESPLSRIAAERAARRIIEVLREQGFIAYLAGGCVRDMLLGLSPSDFDVATDATPDQVLRAFPDAHEVGKAFGVVLVRMRRGETGEAGGRSLPGASVEVATFRREGVYTDRRRPDSVDFCGPDEDARRRDFTINALFLDPLRPGSTEQQVIDTVGGLEDLRLGVIRAVGDPEARLSEDHLRALRAVRFAARLGFEIEQRTAAAIRKHSRALVGISCERIGDEVRTMLSPPASLHSRMRAIGLMESLGLADPVLDWPAKGELDQPGTLSEIEGETDFATTVCCWLHDRDGMGYLSYSEAGNELHARAERLRKSLVLSNEEYDRMREISHGIGRIAIGWEGLSIADRKRLAAQGWFAGVLLMLRGRDPELAKGIESARDELSGDGIGLSPEPWVTGADLIEAGLAPGPSFKERLDRAYSAQLDGSARTRSEALQVALRD